MALGDHADRGIVARYHRERTTKSWTMTCLMASLRKSVSVEFVDTNVSVGCSTATHEQRDDPASDSP